jgi:ABC-type transport system substrate-binding protein
MVPTTSAVRRQYARLVQEQLRGFGVQVELDELEGPVFGQRAGTGRFDALIGIWDVEPSFAAINDLWTRQGIGGPNWVRYSNPAFEELVTRASAGSGTPGQVRDLWRQALELFNDDAPAVMLFATSNVAAVDGRIEDVVIRPDSYWALVRGWRIPVDKLNARDRAAPAN